jgi:hypothetical protein
MASSMAEAPVGVASLDTELALVDRDDAWAPPDATAMGVGADVVWRDVETRAGVRALGMDSAMADLGDWAPSDETGVGVVPSMV